MPNDDFKTQVFGSTESTQTQSNLPPKRIFTLLLLLLFLLAATAGGVFLYKSRTLDSSTNPVITEGGGGTDGKLPVEDPPNPDPGSGSDEGNEIDRPERGGGEITHEVPPPPPTTPSPLPAVSINNIQGEIYAGEPATFGSSGNVPGLEWNFGDNSGTKSGPTVSHTYGKPGTYEIILSAPNRGEVNRKEVFVQVGPKQLRSVLDELADAVKSNRDPIITSKENALKDLFERGANVEYFSRNSSQVVKDMKLDPFVDDFIVQVDDSGKNPYTTPNSIKRLFVDTRTGKIKKLQLYE